MDPFSTMMRDKFILCLFLTISLTIQVDGQKTLSDIKQPEPIIHFLNGIKRVQSYDVTYSFEVLSYTEAGINAPEVDLTSTDRDVLGFGLGRRFETDVGNNERSIAIKDWKTITSSFEPLFISLSIKASTYLSFLNPSHFHRTFLTDILQDKRTVVKNDNTPNMEDKLLCFKVEGHPALQGQIIKIWLNSERNFALEKMSSYYVRNNRMVLIATTEINLYIQTENDLWMPVAATFIQYSTVSNNVIPVIGYRIMLDQNRSTFNTIKTDDLFRTNSLPVVNWTKGKWSCYYPPKALAGIKEADKIEGEMMMHALKYTIRWPFYLVLGLLFIVVPFFLLKRRNSSNIIANRGDRDRISGLDLKK